MYWPAQNKQHITHKKDWWSLLGTNSAAKSWNILIFVKPFKNKFSEYTEIVTESHPYQFRENEVPLRTSIPC